MNFLGFSILDTRAPMRGSCFLQEIRFKQCVRKDNLKIYYMKYFYDAHLVPPQVVGNRFKVVPRLYLWKR
jgi:hypothetical protein